MCSNDRVGALSSRRHEVPRCPACAWRIRSVTQSAHAVQSCTHWRGCYRSLHARNPHPRHLPTGHLRETTPPRWLTCSRRRILVAQASVAHPSRSESHHARSRCARADHPVRERAPHPEACRDPQAVHVIEVPEGLGGSQIPHRRVFRIPHATRAVGSLRWTGNNEARSRGLHLFLAEHGVPSEPLSRNSLLTAISAGILRVPRLKPAPCAHAQRLARVGLLSLRH